MEPTQDLKLPSELRLCGIDAIEDGGALRVDIEGRAPLAVYRLDGKFYVSDDTCTHGEASLAEGLVEDGYIECPWHSGRFCLKTGAALTFPAITPIRVYLAIVRDGMVFIDPQQDAT
jgi:nitrite reductase/ring-hydroxylating ferredoxin subunit